MSHKTKSLLELLTGIILVFGYLWLIYPLHSRWVQVIFLIPILVFFIYSDFINKRSFKENIKDIGFRMDNWYDSFKILIVFTSISIPVLFIIWQFFFPVNNYFYKELSFWRNFIGYPLGALGQEYIFLAFFFRRYKIIFSPYTNIAIIFSAFTFSMIHIPTPPLIIFCFIAGIVWASTYNKYPNLFTIAISHAILGIFCTCILLVYMNVGPKAHIGRWCNSDAVHGSIDSVNNIKVRKHINSKTHVLDVVVNNESHNIYIQGWIASIDNIKKIQISFGGKDYSVNYGTRREDVAAFFNNPVYLYSGFNVNIPISDFSLGHQKLYLKVYLEGKLFSIHYPYPKIWINPIHGSASD